MVWYCVGTALGNMISMVWVYYDQHASSPTPPPFCYTTLDNVPYIDSSIIDYHHDYILQASSSRASSKVRLSKEGTQWVYASCGCIASRMISTMHQGSYTHAWYLDPIMRMMMMLIVLLLMTMHQMQWSPSNQINAYTTCKQWESEWVSELHDM